MNEDILKGKWKQIRGAVKAKWGRLTDDQLDRIAGQRDMLVGKIQELYGESKEHVAKAVQELVRLHDEKEAACCDGAPSHAKHESAKGNG